LYKIFFAIINPINLFSFTFLAILLRWQQQSKRNIKYLPNFSITDKVSVCDRVRFISKTEYYIINPDYNDNHEHLPEIGIFQS